MTQRGNEPGRVTLVGAGPGDPELLTLAAVRALGESDLVLYDALVPPEVLAMVRGLSISVGKRAGKKSWSQDDIVRLMIRAARSGRRVVRLKCGDPFVFGRGGEEMLSVRAAGIACDVVPGVSSAIAAAASAGVPVTHRGLSSSFIVLTGQPEAFWRDAVARLVPSPGSDVAPPTLVFLMSVGARAEIVSALARHGWPRETPALLVMGATQRRSFRWAGPVSELANAEIPEGARDLPGTIVVGAVAGLARIGELADLTRHAEVTGGAA